MIKLTAAAHVDAYRLRLRFSDASEGIFDFSPFISAGTAMTEPLRDPSFFSKFFIELGALSWPNGFDLSAASLHERLASEGLLIRGSEAA